jgi:hypothetical protein
MKRLALALCLALSIPAQGHAGPLKWIRGKFNQWRVHRVLKGAGFYRPRTWGVSNKGHILPGGGVVAPMRERLGSVRASAMKLAATAVRLERQGNGVVFRGPGTVLGTLRINHTTGITLDDSAANEQWQVRFGRQQAHRKVDFSTDRDVDLRTVKVIHKKGGKQVAAMREKVIHDTVTKEGAVVTDLSAASLTNGREGYYTYTDSSVNVHRFGAVWADGQKQGYVVERGRIRMTPGRKSHPTVRDVADSHVDPSRMPTPNADRARDRKIEAERDRQHRERMREDFRRNGA